jgi:uncharacterized membrane protein
VCTAFAILASAPLRAQAPPASPEECTPGQLVDFCTAIPSDLPPGRGFLLDKEVYRTFEAPGAALTTIYAINNRGQMVGQYVDAAGALHGFLLDQGVFTTIDAPGATVTVPFAINNHGQIVGRSSDGVRNRRFLLRNGRFMRITPPGAFIPYFIGTLATDIDDRGRIASAYDLVQHGYVRHRRGDVSTFDHPDAGRTTEGVGINSRG